VYLIHLEHYIHRSYKAIRRCMVVIDGLSWMLSTIPVGVPYT
jgi:hypothetical protein